MKIFRKVLFILLIANIIRIVPGCIEDCDLLPVYFDFTSLQILNLDNSGEWEVENTTDSMQAAAIAFELVISDYPGNYPHYSAADIFHSFGFKSSHAMSHDCSQPMIANHYLTDIRIATLYDINAELHAGDDVTAYFVGQFSTNTSPVSGVYLDLATIIAQMKNKVYYDFGVEAFGIYLKPEVETPQSRFVISLTFSDNRILTDTTRLIHILH